MKRTGFTLAELLIALALLGVIAAFTILKVLQANAEQERVAKLRETVATLEQAWYNAKATNSLPSAGTFQGAMQESLNTVRQEVTSVFAAGRPLEGLNASHPCAISGFGYFQFANGVVMSGVSQIGYGSLQPPAISTQNTLICIDVNGALGPNQAGQDAFVGNFNPWGDFDVGGSAYTAGTNNKTFLWGNQTEVVRATAGAPLAAPFDVAEGRAGTWLTR